MKRERIIRILFVCTGNLCRSPIAEGILRAKLLKSGLADQALVDSAGIHAELGEVTGKRPSTISAYIRELRTEGYLTSAGSGKAGGVMTEKSRKILRQAGEM